MVRLVSPGGQPAIFVPTLDRDQPGSSRSISPLSSPPSDISPRRDSKKRPIFRFEERGDAKRARTGSPVPRDDAAKARDGRLPGLRNNLPAKFKSRFESLMRSNGLAAEDWVLPAHHRFMAALCQSVGECVGAFRRSQGRHAEGSDAAEALFQDALGIVAEMARTDEKTILKRFLDDPDHAAYREVVENPELFELRCRDTEAAFANAAEKIRRLVPGYTDRADKMWKLCIDPKTIALLEKKNIDTEHPLVGRFLFEGEKHFLHNMACGWEFIADAALNGSELTLGLLETINAICTGRPASGGSLQYASGGTKFGLLFGHTLSLQGLKELEITVASLQANGLKVRLIQQGKYPGTDLDCYELHHEVDDEKDGERLTNWARQCIDDYRTKAAHLKGDALALCDLELALKLNQTHVFADGNIRTCQLLLNFLRLRRGQTPFMLREPNVMDGHTAGELLALMRTALADSVYMDVWPVMKSAQVELPSTIIREEAKPALKQKRNIPPTRAYIAFNDYVLNSGGTGISFCHFQEFTTFMRDRGLSLEGLKGSPTEFFEARRNYCKLVNDKSVPGTGGKRQRRMLTELTAYLFPNLGVPEIAEYISNKSNELKLLKKCLWDLVEFLHCCNEAPNDLRELLRWGSTKISPSKDDWIRFTNIYARFCDYFLEEKNGAQNISTFLKNRLDAAFFSSPAEDELMGRFRRFLTDLSLADRSVNNYLSILQGLKGEASLSFINLKGNLADFIELYSRHSESRLVLSYLGYFLFYNDEIGKICSHLINGDFKNGTRRNYYLSWIWKLEAELRARKIDGIGGLGALAPVDGNVKIRECLDAFSEQKGASAEAFVTLKTEIINAIYPGAEFSQCRETEADISIKALQEFFKSKTEWKKPRGPISTYLPGFRTLRQAISVSGWNVKDINEFLEFRRSLVYSEKTGGYANAPDDSRLYKIFNVLVTCPVFSDQANLG